MISACRVYRAPKVKPHSNLLSTKCKVMFWLILGKEEKKEKEEMERGRRKKSRRGRRKGRGTGREKFIIVILFNSTYVFK